MNARAGVVTSQVAWLSAAPFAASEPKGAAAGFLVAAFASFLPDLDHHKATAGRYMPALFRWLVGGHRMGTHSLVAIGSAWWLTGWLLENPAVANAMAIGWASHVVLDMLTIHGVGLLYPFSRCKFRIGWFVTGSSGEDWFVLCMKVLGALVGVIYGYLFATGGLSPWS